MSISSRWKVTAGLNYEVYKTFVKIRSFPFDVRPIEGFILFNRYVLEPYHLKDFGVYIGLERDFG